MVRPEVSKWHSEGEVYPVMLKGTRSRKWFPRIVTGYSCWSSEEEHQVAQGLLDRGTCLLTTNQESLYLM